MIKLFTTHPNAVNETYLQHFCFACKTGIKLMWAGVACFIHGLFPFLFVTTGSEQVKKVVANMEERIGK